MAFEKSQKILSAFVVLQILFATAKANELAIRGSQYNTTSSLEDYIEENRRQYAAQVASYEADIANFQAAYQKQLVTIENHRDYVVSRLLEVENKLNPLELLSELTKHCVQKYRNILVSPAAVRTQYTSCISSATSSLNSILSTPQSTYRTLSNYLNSNFRTGINNCKQKFNETQITNLTICVAQFIDTSNTYFANNQRTFNTQMEAARCSADTRIKQAVECTFPTLNNALSSIGESTRLIDDCIAGIGLCEPCPEAENSTIIVEGPQCPNVITVITDVEMYSNATIRNPFHGLGHLSCVLINFLPTSSTAAASA